MKTFTTTPSKIAQDHAEQVRDLTEEGIAAAMNSKAPKITFERIVRDCGHNDSCTNPRQMIYDFEVLIDGERRALFHRNYRGTGYRLVSNHGYTRDQLHFKREHTGELVPSGPAHRPLWPFAVGAAFALLIGCQLIVKSLNSTVALFGLIACLVGLVIVWFIFQQLVARDG